MTLLIQQPALLMTVQDGGRRGYQRYGMPASGPMDWWAFRAANLLLGNAPEAACVEVGFSSAEIQLQGRALLAVCGTGFRLTINHIEMPLWMAFLGRPGDTIRFEKRTGGNWAYLAVAGGIQSPVWMGSRSAYPAAGLGKPLAAGEHLNIPVSSAGGVMFAGRAIPQAQQPAYAADPVIGVIPGPHLYRFAQGSWETFLAGAYKVSTQSNRMGYRLTGPSLAHHSSADLVSQAIVLGAVQVPGDGQPIVMMADHPTTGGYTIIATVARTDLPLLAQVEPGRGTLRFKAVDLHASQQAWVGVVKMLDQIEFDQEDLWTGF